MNFDPVLLVLPLLIAMGIVCAAIVCIVAICRAHRTDTVAVLKALPELTAAFLRYRQGPRR
ncbi:hypothetical protein [Streptomyces sp. NPDC127084]|uniref:hypothetical protein n=1 Tax=Streptomyces sp. NPDC127084 TaxID=3347133 RepID=UPI003663E817